MRYDYSMNYKGQTLEQLIKDYGGHEVSAMQVYSDMFELGYGLIQKTGEQYSHKANPIILGNWDGRIKRRIMLEDTFEQQLTEFQQADWAILNGLTYWGYANTANNQSDLRAFIFDLDGITPQLFNNFLHAAYDDVLDGHGVYPIPNYVILSGTNVHLYYLIEFGIKLYPKAKVELKKLKYGLIHRMWNRYTSTIEKPQYQGINQGFRVIGGKTKHGDIVRAFQLNTTPFSIRQLNEYVLDEEQADVNEFDKPITKYTLAEAKKLFPKWYEQVIVQGLPAEGVWRVKEDLYNWWLRKLQNGKEVSFGHRYFCIMALAIFAAKCNILDRDRVRKDALDLMPLFNSIKPDEPFTTKDIDSALDCLDLRYCTFPRKDIEKITAISIPPNKRNGLKREQHLEIARAIRDVKQKQAGTDWRDGNGRPKGSLNKVHKKKNLILDYKKLHPKASQREIAKALNISPTTVNKWLKQDKN